MSSFRSRTWCFTMNNPEPCDGSQIVLSEGHQYVVFQLEIGVNGTPHYQGFVQYKNPTMASIVQGWLKNLAHVSPQGRELKDGKWVKMHGSTPSKARRYCMKEDTRVAGPWELGVWSEPLQGKRNDLEAFKDDVKAGKDWDYLVENHSSVVASKPGFVALYCNKHRKRKLIPDDVILQPWQQWVVDIAASEPDDRAVYWFYDPVGGRGKTFVTKYLAQKGGLFLCNGGKAVDICFAYNGEKVCVFNYARDHADYVGYGPIEQLKDGIFFSSKYQSMTKYFDPPHVFIFANFVLDRSKMSADRIHFIQFDPDHIRYTPPGSLIKQIIE